MLVVDGTQAFEFDNVHHADYYALSTHKWLANVKTCGILFYNENAALPNHPPAISFGYKKEDIQGSFIWTGMNSQIPCIVLGKAIQIFAKYGKQQAQNANDILQ